MTRTSTPAPAEQHLSYRSNWLRAAVLGANDGIVSTSSLVLGVAGSGAGRSAILTAGVAGLVAGALSMAAGEYVSVSSQRDTELADERREAAELRDDPEGEREELAGIYRERGLSPALAGEVADALMEHDALGAHLRDELGFDDDRLARPVQAAWSSAAAFSIGAAWPLLAVLVLPGATRIVGVVAITLAALAALGTAGAHLGGARLGPATRRVLGWGAAAMAVTYGIGALVGTVA
jgi:VIT1/CCC1 family predicted Fe2+/Mn2+ transporter